jgi:hypothetical protein
MLVVLSPVSLVVKKKMLNLIQLKNQQLRPVAPKEKKELKTMKVVEENAEINHVNALFLITVH